VTLVVDSSAIIALLLDEPEASSIEFALAESFPVVISAATLVEVSLVAESRLGPQGALADRPDPSACRHRVAAALTRGRFASA
jgi:uncharacterized protein with PIN domain